MTGDRSDEIGNDVVKTVVLLREDGAGVMLFPDVVLLGLTGLREAGADGAGQKVNVVEVPSVGNTETNGDVKAVVVWIPSGGAVVPVNVPNGLVVGGGSLVTQVIVGQLVTVMNVPLASTTLMVDEAAPGHGQRVTIVSSPLVE